MMKRVLSIFMYSALLIMVSCSVEEANNTDVQESYEDLYRQLVNLTDGRGPLPQPPIWADCDLYSGIVTPATFTPNSDSFDELYVMPEATFYDGVPLISDSKPGDQDYNGGRWHLNVLKEGVDPTIYAEACVEEDLDPMDFDSTDMYFACPLRPRRN